jgi:hypothetical protein
MDSERFASYLKANIPFVGDATVRRLTEAGITSVAALGEVTYDGLVRAGVRRPAANAILLYVLRQKRLVRFRKNFDNYFDPSDLVYLVPSALLFCVFAALHVAAPFAVPEAIAINWFVADVLYGLYWIFVFVKPSRTGSFSEYALIPTFAGFLALVFATMFSLTTADPVLPFVLFSVVVASITMWHSTLLRYRNPLNVKEETVSQLGMAIVALGVVGMALEGVTILRNPDMLGRMSAPDLLQLVLFFVFLAIVIPLGHRVTETREVMARTTLVHLYLLVAAFAGFVLFHLLFGAGMTTMDVHLGVRMLQVLVPLSVLYAYLLFPTRYFPRLGLLFVVTGFLNLLVPLAVQIGPFPVGEDFWSIIGKTSDVVQLIGFLFFSGTVVHLLFRRAAAAELPKDVEDLVEDACTEILRWSDNQEPSSQYRSYWDASNRCFQNGFFQRGIDILKSGLAKKRWRYYDEAIFHYQLACGYSLLGDEDSAVSHLERALHLYPYLRKFVEKDEMLAGVSANFVALELATAR